jgi:nitronate monooxygenase
LLHTDFPVVAAPMAGGPSAPRLVSAAGRAGRLAFLAAGYLTADRMAAEIRTVRDAGASFGVNVFAPYPVPVDPAEFRAYARRISADGARYGVDPTVAGIVEDDDDWQAKIELLVADPVPVVSFTFGFPDAAVIGALQRAGSTVALTVTSPDEARAATALGPDILVVQSADAGGHLGTLTPQRPPERLSLPDLVRAVRQVRGLPLLAAGGIGTAEDAAAAVAAGAAAVAVGTVLLRTDESAASEPYKHALGEAERSTVVTRAFTGRPARGLRNEFTDAHSADAPLGYPAVHYLTRPIRRAAAAAGDAERLNLWAGTGYRHAGTGPVRDALDRLAARL